MRYYSTNKQAVPVDFKTATIQGQAPDKGLYFPEFIPIVPEGLIKNIETYSNEAIAYEVIKPYIGNTIQDKDLKRIVEETIDFPIPLTRINENISSLELYHGPTLAFKDVGARFMSRCLGTFVKDQSKKVTVLVATSGDTGGAVANGFYDVPGVDVVILYPSGKVSSVQEKQLTTLGKNIHALEVKGSFDDCQQMVKDVFANAADFPHLFLTSANSINVARWLPQQFYYFFAYKELKLAQSAGTRSDWVVSVPSGNFGNICAGILANASGLPVQHFVAACNSNDTIPQFLQTGTYPDKKAVPTISNAMDVANPSNFVRIMEVLGKEIPALKKKVSAYSISDDKTRATIKKVYTRYGYLLDPHGAVGYAALEKYLADQAFTTGIIVETAHPVKFYDVVEPVIRKKIEIPESIKQQFNAEKRATLIDNKTQELIDYLTKK